MLSNNIRLLLFWLVAVGVHLTLLISAWDMFPPRHEYTQLKQETEPRHSGHGRRVVVFLVAGINASLLFTTLRNDNHPLLKSQVIEGGRWGVSWSPAVSTSSENILTILSGAKTEELTWFNKPLNQPDVITRNLDRTIYVGGWGLKENSLAGDWERHPYPEDWSKYKSHYDDNAMDDWVAECTHGILDKPSNDNATVSNTTLFLIHFEGLRIINKFEGKQSPKTSIAASRILKLVESLVNKFNQVYEDQQTLFFLVSNSVQADVKDYGISQFRDQVVPILTWGVGVSEVSDNKTPSLKSSERRDIDYVDIAPLSACILGVPTPAHSIGRLHFSYLINNSSLIASCALSNIKQLQALANYEYQSVNRRSLIKLSQLFEPIALYSISEKYEAFTENIDKHKYNVVLNEAETLILSILDTITYYRYYYSRLAKVIVSILYCLWFLYLASSMMKLDEALVAAQDNSHPENSAEAADNADDERKPAGQKRATRPSIWRRLFVPKVILTFSVEFTYTLASSILLSVAVLAGWPHRVTIYLAVMLLIARAVIAHGRKWFVCRRNVIEKSEPLSPLKFTAFLLILLLLSTFYYSERVITVVSMLLILVLSFTDYREVKSCYLTDWILTFLPVMFFMSHHSELATNQLSVIAQIAACSLFYLSVSVWLRVKIVDFFLIVYSLFAVGTATVINFLVHERIMTDSPWLLTLSISCLLVIIIGSNTVSVRLSQSAACLSIPYVLTATGYEPITYMCIVVHLSTWLTVETYRRTAVEVKLPIVDELPRRSTRTDIEWPDIRRADLSSLYLLICYLAMGSKTNIFEIFQGIDEQMISSWTPLLYYIFKLVCLMSAVTMVYMLICNISNASSNCTLSCSLFVLNFLGLTVLAITIVMNAIETDAETVSLYVITQFIVMSFLVSYPIALGLTSKSVTTHQTSQTATAQSL